MTTTRDDATTSAALAEVGEASAFPGLRGLRWWAVLLLALALTAGGVAVDVLREGTLGVVFLAAYPGGCVLAAVLAQRRDIFVPMVQPPLLLAVSVPVAIAATGTLPASGGLVSTALAVGAPLINGFPAMAVTTVMCVLIGLVRMRVQRWHLPDAEARREPVRSGPAAAPTRDARPRDDRDRDRERDRGRDRERERERAREERDRREAAERADAADRREQAERDRRRAQERARAERDREMAERDRAARERREQDLAERERARRDRDAKAGSKSGSKKRPKARDERPDEREQLARGAAEVPPGPMPRRSPLKGAGRDEAPARDKTPPREPAPRDQPPRDQPAPRDARSREDRMREERLREERRAGPRPPGVHPVRERPPERPPR
ncbi:DUF6542 domain-containing protein [Actinomycetospora soli]|uniref:DUF6542 domain-containing protein n=1 Tax=Actinomycetospora soli TaxID=2893887 RepID=UPI001E403CF0|nr:DUF6542 domain-containing protein [Actinomycetospora soli]MCD2187279.1 hypothetical protein [Actinomycetospora soli]